MVTIDPQLARSIMQARTGIDPAAMKLILEANKKKAKAAKAKKYWLIGGGITLVAIVGGVLIYKSKNKG